MLIDLMLVDDYPDVLNVYDREAKSYGLETITFDSGVEALKYLRMYVADLPRSYVVDMKILPGIDELDSPLEIYRFLEENNRTEYFRFNTGTISAHDKQVQEQTGATILVKYDDRHKLTSFFEELATTKPNP